MTMHFFQGFSIPCRHKCTEQKRTWLTHVDVNLYRAEETPKADAEL